MTTKAMNNFGEVPIKKEDIKIGLKVNRCKDWPFDKQGDWAPYGEVISVSKTYRAQVRWKYETGYDKTFWYDLKHLTYFEEPESAKEPTGYRLLKDLPGQKAGKLLDKAKNGYDKTYYVIEDYEFSESDIEEFSDWFEPVYIVTEEVIITHDEDDYSYKDAFSLVINSEGSIKLEDVEDEDETFIDYQELKNLVDSIKAISGPKGNNWEVYIKKINIGCKIGVRVDDLEEAVNTYEKLNGIKK